MEEFGLGVAFVAGVISFFSPCVVPLIPGYLAYISGTSIKELQKGSRELQTRVFTNAIFFTLGFSGIFVLLGLIISGAFGQVSPETQIWLARIGGVIIISFGLNAIGLLDIPIFEKTIKYNVKGFKPGYLRSSSLGIAFGVGWTPCFGPILTSIIILAGTTGSVYLGASLLIAYSLGLGIPFLLTGLATDRAFRFINSHQKAFNYFNIVAGVLLIGLGIVVFTNQFAVLLAFTYDFLGLG
jgi:cytochrome c-type biogenesis protein